MATLGNTLLTLSDWAKRLDPDGSLAVVVEAMDEVNEVLDDIPFRQGNMTTGHKTTQRTGLPETYWRELNKGVPVSKGHTAHITDTCGMIEGRSQVDADLASLEDNLAQFRLGEAKPFMESMSQKFASSIFYSSTKTDPERIMGLAPRFSDLTSDTAANMVGGGGTEAGNNTSIWLVCWGSETAFGMFPKGSKAGITHIDKNADGKTSSLTDADGLEFEGYKDIFQWKVGLCVRDWRFVVRIHSIKVSSLTGDLSGGADLVDLMTDAIEIPPSLKGKCAFYCNKTIRTILRKQIRNAKNVNISMGEVAGKKAIMFDEVPIRRVDAILNTEDAITA